MDNALAETEARREAHRQKERDLQIQSQASDQAAEQIPSMRYHYKPLLHFFINCSLATLWQFVLYMHRVLKHTLQCAHQLPCGVVACRSILSVAVLLSKCATTDMFSSSSSTSISSHTGG